MNKLKSYELISTIKSLLKDSSSDNIELINNILHDNDYLSFPRTDIISLLCHMPHKFKELVESERFDEFQLGEIANQINSKTIEKYTINLNFDELTACLDYIESFTTFSHTYYIKECADEIIVDEFLEKIKSKRYVTQDCILEVCAMNPKFISIIDFNRISQETLIKTLCIVNNHTEYSGIDADEFNKYKTIFFDNRYRLIDKIVSATILDEIIIDKFYDIGEDIAQYIIDDELLSVKQIHEYEYYLSVSFLTIMESKFIKRNAGKYNDIFGLSKRYNEFDAYDWHMLLQHMDNESKEKLTDSAIFLDSIKNIIKKKKDEKWCFYPDTIIDTIIKHIDEFQLVYDMNENLIYDVYLKEIGLFYNTSFRTICLPKLSSSHWMQLIPKNKKYYEHHKQLLKQGATNE